MKPYRGYKDFNGLAGLRQFEGKNLCVAAYAWLESLTPEDLDAFARTVMGGAIMFIANTYAQEFDKPRFHIKVGVYDE